MSSVARTRCLNKSSNLRKYDDPGLCMLSFSPMSSFFRAVTSRVTVILFNLISGISINQYSPGSTTWLSLAWIYDTQLRPTALQKYYLYLLLYLMTWKTLNFSRTCKLKIQAIGIVRLTLVSKICTNSECVRPSELMNRHNEILHINYIRWW